MGGNAGASALGAEIPFFRLITTPVGKTVIF